MNHSDDSVKRLQNGAIDLACYARKAHEIRSASAHASIARAKWGIRDHYKNLGRLATRLIAGANRAWRYLSKMVAEQPSIQRQ